MHHPADLNFYDELGIEPCATPEQIRDSFRALVRIVHPDHQTDEQLKEIAETQMRKLNRIYATLSDPEKRRRYDQTLEKSFGPTIVMSPESALNMSRLAGRMAWVGAVFVTVVGLIWLASDSPAARQAGTADNGGPAVAGSPSGKGSGATAEEVAQLRTELQHLRAEHDLALRELARLKGVPAKPSSRANPDSPPENPPALPTTLTELPSPVTPGGAALINLTPPGRTALSKPAAPPAPAAAQTRSFAGFWFYMKEFNPKAKASTLYPPEFIELTLTEQGGTVKGRYRSRYKIVDRAISPDVSFEFAGNPVAGTVTAPWSGPGGSKGEITLKMPSENSLKVDWSTTELGSFQGLVNGTATLTRRLD